MRHKAEGSGKRRSPHCLTLSALLVRKLGAYAERLWTIAQKDRAKSRRSVSCYWQLLLLVAACIADARATRIDDAAPLHAPSNLDGSATPTPTTTSTTQMPTTQEGNDTSATNATFPENSEQFASGDTPPPGQSSEQTCKQTLKHIAIRPGGGSQWCACAVERQDCKCSGRVRFGKAEGSLWSTSVWINGTISCRERNFGGDPAREKSPCFLCPLA